MGFIVKKVALGSLNLDLRNPRYPQTGSQEEAFDLMVTNLTGEIGAIAQHIKEHGLNPSTNPIIYETPFGEYVVKDGNRRITAIKAMMNPKKISREHIKLREKFTRIGKDLDRSKYRYILCTVFDDEIEADRWVEVNHQGPQNGIGQKKWNPIQKMRDQSNRGIFNPTLDIFEFWQENSGDNVDEDKFPVSTLERLVNDAEFRAYAFLEIESDDKAVVRYRDSGEIVQLLRPVIEDIRTGQVTSRSINDKKSISDYVSKLKNECRLDIEDTLDSPLPLFDDDSTEDDTTPAPQRPRKKSGRKPARRLIEESYAIDIPVPRIKDVFDDIRRMDVYKNTNSLSILLRTFLEMSIRYYHDTNGMGNGRTAFAERIEDCANDLAKKGLLSTNQLISIKLTLKRKENAISLAMEFNQFGHNYSYNPTPESIIHVWNNIEGLVSGMFMAK